MLDVGVSAHGCCPWHNSSAIRFDVDVHAIQNLFRMNTTMVCGKIVGINSSSQLISEPDTLDNSIVANFNGCLLAQAPNASAVAVIYVCLKQIILL